MKRNQKQEATIKFVTCACVRLASQFIRLRFLKSCLAIRVWNMWTQLDTYIYNIYIYLRIYMSVKVLVTVFKWLQQHAVKLLQTMRELRQLHIELAPLGPIIRPCSPGNRYRTIATSRYPAQNSCGSHSGQKKEENRKLFICGYSDSR